MNHEIDVVQQDPFGLLVALDVRGADAGLPESLLYFIGDGLNLPGVATGANNKEVGEAARGLVQLEDGLILGLFGRARFDRLIDLPFHFGFFCRHVTSKVLRARCSVLSRP